MFSTTVKLADLDDFLTPAQECIKPILDAAKKTKVENDSLEIRPNLIKPRKKVKQDEEEKDTQTTTEVAQVSLYDCLACAGCVTSAEAVLIEQQGTAEFMKGLKSNRLSVVSVSPQSRTALAMYFQMTPVTLMRKLCGFLKSLGATYVVDMSASDALTLLETRSEFAERYAQHQREPSGRHLPLLTSHCPGWVCYAEKILEPELICHMSGVMSSQQIQGRLVKTMLRKQHNARTAVMRYRNAFPSPARFYFVGPGFVVNPTNGKSSTPEADLDLLASEISEESIHKALEEDGRNFVSGRPAANETKIIPKFPEKEKAVYTASVKANDIYHACVMPCYDKKLEATRPDFRQPPENGVTRGNDSSEEIVIPDVDVVLATTEILRLLGETGTDLEEMPEVDMDDLTLGMPIVPEGCCAADSPVSVDPVGPGLTIPLRGNFSSGGFLDDVFRYSSEKLFDIKLSDEPLQLRIGRNADYKDVVLKKDEKVVLRFAMAYGFRNIQNVMRVIKSRVGGENPVDRVGADELVPHFVEIMACPSGCLNGGGQIPPSAQKPATEAKDNLATELVADEHRSGEAGQSRPEVLQPETDADRMAEAAAAAAEARETEDSTKRRRRIEELEYLLHDVAQGNTAVPAENHPQLRAINAFLGRSNGEADKHFRTSWRSLKQMAAEQEVLMPSSLKW